MFVCYDMKSSLILLMNVGNMIDGVPHPVVVRKALDCGGSIGRKKGSKTAMYLKLSHLFNKGNEI